MLTINTEDISTTLKKRLAALDVKPQVYSYGRVVGVADGVARIEGLPNRCYGELLEFGTGVFGMALELEENRVGAVLLNTADVISAGDIVRGTNHTTEIPVGNAVLGRVIDPIGRPLDNLPLFAEEFLPVERPAPSIIDRRPVDTPLETGIVSIDSMIPIGRGQRELIIGDRQTGKTSIAIDTILNQKNSGVICIYCAIGQKASSIAQIIETLKKKEAMKYCVVVCSTASDSPAMQYLTPYSACSIAEKFMSEGKDVLIVYDDLSKHAVSYRTMSLLLHRPPGREAYPGDVFYLHSRLLERSACLSSKLGGGSMTALPIIETTGGNISAYIPTNVISITDGQIYLEGELFHSGIRPAINTSLSVSRVGRAAQHAAMKKVSGLLRIELAQYKEMAIFARFGSDIDAQTKSMLERGECLTYLFKQDKNKPYKLSQEITMLIAYRENAFNDIKIADLKAAVFSLFDYVQSKSRHIVDYIDENGDYTQQQEEELCEIINAWKASV